ncbi:extracellular mutant protein 11-domain-containing protein [Stachybotrys elegans]|uniref:Extracellular mutant protein 11-domain-containing protein n=1 Tax=Stachybotrys elegans TaxID=80388 RepID=A0A8K0T044_9HYPO|nr:extracellular mutant protein 11-domain-containing protein [Stachybotrys elegans]
MPTSPRTRPMSILSPFKSKAQRQPTSPPDKKPAHRPPSAARTDAMAPGIKARSGKLAAFAHGISNGPSSEAIAQYQGPPPAQRLIPDKRAPTPLSKRSPTPQRAPTSPPTKQTRLEAAEAARLPIPKNTRYARDNGISSPPPPQSPPNDIHPALRRPRANSNDNNGGLFAGSQLGESFMNSGLTTPQNERDEVLSDAVYDTKRSPPRPARAIREQLEPPARSSDDASFYIREDGMMTVVTGSKRHDPAYLKDGFQETSVNIRKKSPERRQNARELSTSPAEKQRKLPYRDSKRQRSYVEVGGYGDEPRSSSPTFESTVWQAQMKTDAGRSKLFREMDDDVVSSVEPDATTPKASKVSKSKVKPPQKSLMESSMPPVMMSRNDSRDKKRRRSFDYDDMDLSAMAFSDLLRQPFDHDPSRGAAPGGHDIRGETQADKLERFRRQGEKEQRQMFVRMSMDDWETAGDWFVDQFTDLMQKMKQARQNKRRMIKKFEAEIAEREEAVRLRSEAIDRKLVKMKQDGQRVVEDKDV